MATAHSGFQRDNLKTYLDSLHWDAEKSGPLLVIEPARRPRDPGGAEELAGYKMKILKVGGASVVAQSWTASLDEDNLHPRRPSESEQV